MCICSRIYWTDCGVEQAKIESAALDGTRRTVVINSSLVWPNGLAIDRLERRLYWADAELDRIEMAFVNGSGRRVLLSENLPHVFGFALLGMSPLFFFSLSTFLLFAKCKYGLCYSLISVMSLGSTIGQNMQIPCCHLANRNSELRGPTTAISPLTKLLCVAQRLSG